MTLEIRKPYTRERVPFDQSIPDLVTGEVQTSRTKQSFAEESEINNIISRYIKTGVIDHVKNHAGYADFPDPVDYQTALQLTIDAQIAFDGLPAETRREFNNDPYEFLSFIENPDNIERMGELGLLADAPDDPSSEAEPASEAASEPAPGADD